VDSVFDVWPLAPPLQNSSGVGSEAGRRQHKNPRPSDGSSMQSDKQKREDSGVCASKAITMDYGALLRSSGSSSDPARSVAKNGKSETDQLVGRMWPYWS
jgi:hypothetical protein